MNLKNIQSINLKAFGTAYTGFLKSINILKEINRLEESIRFDSEFQGKTVSTEDSTGVKTYNISTPQAQTQLDIRKLRHLTTQLSYIENGGAVRNNDNSLNEEWAKVKYTDEFPNG